MTNTESQKEKIQSLLDDAEYSEEDTKFLLGLLERVNNFQEVITLEDIALRKVLLNFNTSIPKDHIKLIKHSIHNAIYLEKLTFATLKLIYTFEYELYLEMKAYPKWFWNAVCATCGQFTLGYTRKESGWCSDCNRLEEIEIDYCRLAYEAMGFKRRSVCYDGCSDSSSDYYEPDVEDSY